MDELKLSEREIAAETFKLLMSAFSLRNSCFDEQSEAEIKKFKANRKKYFILFCIYRKESCTLSDLERILLENRSTASVAVSKLYHEGYISKNQPEKGDDGRKVYFKVTEKGRAIIAAHGEIFMKSVRSFYSELSDEDKCNYVKGIVSLNKIFDNDENL